MESSVIAGDINSCLNPRLDKSHKRTWFGVGLSQSLLSCCTDIDFIDRWRSLHLTEKQYTFYTLNLKSVVVP